uniref:Uncharacterized protein n=1 Tax=Oryza brachyantha TaxID=4533 RepID=J3M036_ORYBR
RELCSNCSIINFILKYIYRNVIFIFKKYKTNLLMPYQWAQCIHAHQWARCITCHFIRRDRHMINGVRETNIR